MHIIRKRAAARAGLVGNPSDGYHGKTISFAFDDFHAEVVLYEWPVIEFLPAPGSTASHESLAALAKDVHLHGYYDGTRLLKALAKRFFEHCRDRGHRLHDRRFAMRYATTIPRQVGLAGSSAIVVAGLRALMEFYGIAIAPEAQATLALAVERDELGIAAGLQDRVVQVYGGLVYMDFDKAAERLVDGLRVYRYEPLDPRLLPKLYVAYEEDLGEPTEVFHSNLRERFERGEALVIAAMKQFAALAEEARTALLAADHARLAALMNANFDLRRSICALPARQIAQVETARAAGASAQFAGSGGAIVGIYRDEAMFESLEKALGSIGSRTIRPRLGGF